MKKRSLAWLILLALALNLAGCGRQDDSAPLLTLPVSKTAVQAQAARYAPIEEVGVYNSEIITPELLAGCQLPALDKAALPYWTGCILENKISVNYNPDSAWEEYTAGSWYWNEQEIKYLAENGFNCVRALYSLSFLSNPDDVYSINVSQLEQLDELIAWCIQYNVHLILSQTGLPGKWNLDNGIWHDDYEYWSTQENVGGNPELFASPEMQQVYTAYYDMLARRYQNIPNGVLSFELATEMTLPDTETPTALQAEVLGPVAQTIWSYSPDRIVIVNGVWGNVPQEMAALGCCIADHFHLYAVGEAELYSLPADYERHWPFPYLPSLVDETSGTMVLASENGFSAGELTISYSYYNRRPKIAADGQILFEPDEDEPVYDSGTVCAAVPAGTRQLTIELQGEMGLNWVSLTQEGQDTLLLPASPTNDRPMPVPSLLVGDDGSLYYADGTPVDIRSDDITSWFLQDYLDCAAENGVSFLATEVGTDTLYLSPEEYIAYHEVLLQAYKDHGIGWMYNCIHNILAPKELMWLNSENSRFTDFSNVPALYRYQVNNQVMELLKRFQ